MESSPAITDRRVFFLHIGKNAGTQIKYLGQQLSARGIDFVKLPHRITLPHLPPGSRYFFSIRNPHRRFVSGFYSRKRKGQPRLHVEWSPFERLAFERFEHANDLAEALFRNDALGRDAICAMTSIFHAGMHQIDWFAGALNFDVRPPVWIIRQENLAEDFGTLLQRLDAKAGLSDMEFASEAATAHKGEYRSAPELSSLAKRNLELWYSRDFAFYDLCLDWIKRNGET